MKTKDILAGIGFIAAFVIAAIVIFGVGIGSSLSSQHAREAREPTATTTASTAAPVAPTGFTSTIDPATVQIPSDVTATFGEARANSSVPYVLDAITVMFESKDSTTPGERTVGDFSSASTYLTDSVMVELNDAITRGQAKDSIGSELTQSLFPGSVWHDDLTLTNSADNAFLMTETPGAQTYDLTAVRLSQTTPADGTAPQLIVTMDIDVVHHGLDANSEPTSVIERRKQNIFLTPATDSTTGWKISNFSHDATVVTS